MITPYLDTPASPSARARGTLLLLHAFPVHAGMWTPQFGFAADGWRVIAPQLRGFGDGGADGSAHTQHESASHESRPHQSPPHQSTPHQSTGHQSTQHQSPNTHHPLLTMDDYAGDVIDILDSLHIDDAVVGGLSLGGYVAFALLRLAPRYIRALVLADTRPQADTPDGVEGRKKMIALADSGGAAAVAADMVPRLLGGTTRRDRPAVVDSVRTLAEANSTAAITGALHAMMTRPDSTPLLSTIHVPTLIVVGDEDVVTPPAIAGEMHRAIGGSQLEIIPAAGHLSNLENASAFNAALAGFLAHRV